MKSFISVLIVIFVFNFISFGEDFRYLRSEDGLPDGEINSIAQDSTGNMWFATWSGLIKYDGLTYELFRPGLGDSTSLPDKKVKELYVDSDDNLWIATSQNLCWYDKQKESFHTVRFAETSGAGVNILHLSETEKHLIVHTVEGIYVLPLNKISDTDYFLQKSTIIGQGRNEDYYFHFSTAFQDKLVLVSNNLTSPSHLFLGNLSGSADNPTIEITETAQLDGWVNSIEYVPSENNLYIATTSGMISYSLKKNSFEEPTFFNGKNVHKILYASDNKIYCSMLEPKLLYLDLHTGLTGSFESNPNVSGSLLDNEIHSLYEDFSGNLWVGHQGQGISIYNLFQKEFYTFRRNSTGEATLNSNIVMCFNSTEKEVLIGCRSGGLNILSRDEITSGNPEFKQLALVEDDIPGILHDGIWDIKKQSDSLFWLGTDFGLYRLLKSKSGWSLEPFNGKPETDYEIRKLFIDENNNIWIGSHKNGLTLLPDPGRNPEGLNYSYSSAPDDTESLPGNVILEIFRDSENRFWIGTTNGFCKLKNSYESIDLSGRTKPELEFEQFIATEPRPDFLNNNEINCFFENHDGKLWIATQGGGINIFNPESGTFNHITTADGLPSNDVLGIISDSDGNLWISTAAGLACYNRFDKEPGFKVFSSADGVQGDVFMVNSYYKTPDGQLFFGGDNGFTCFYPDDIKINPVKPRIRFTKLKVKDRIVEVGDTIHKNQVLKESLNFSQHISLPFKMNSFGVGVAALHFQYPKNNRVIYMLENYHEQWQTVPSGSKYIDFSNIPPGNYELKVRAVSPDRLRSAGIKTLGIEIIPPWYKTWYFWGGVNIAGAFLALAVIYFLVNRQRLIYQKKIDKLTIETNENKMMFLTNIAHELRTPLSLVIAPVEDLMNNLTVEKHWKNHLQLIHRNSIYLQRLINQIIDFRKLDAGKLKFQPQKADIVRVIKDVVLNFKGHKANRNIKLYLKVPAESVIVSVDVQKIEEVLYNLISNAYKHTPDNHSITVSMRFAETVNDTARQVCITVFNEGNEINKADRSKIFDRFFKIDENAEGAGIGLSFAKSLVEMHNGTLEVETVPGKGVAFHVCLGFSDVELHDTDIESIDSLQPFLVDSFTWEDDLSEISGSEEKQQVLIVEDNEELGDFLTSIYSRKYDCIRASNGIEAWEIIQVSPPAIVISDIIMPHMDGLELCKKMKENKNTCHVPIILLTAKNASEQIIEGFELGADAYITKPFDINLLLSQTVRLIKNRELIREKYKSQNFMVEVDKNSTSRDDEFVQTVKKTLEANLADPEFNVNKLAGELNISTTQLYRRLKALTGYSPVEFMRILKLQKAYSLLSQRNNTVKEICYLTGFNNLSYFIKCFREQFGVTPANFRDNGLDEKSKEGVKNIMQA
jgi:signal transduction histidine kinase/ligand-binding sensor domain-containing protein/DNA-binding response OmpR family regulator